MIILKFLFIFQKLNMIVSLFAFPFFPSPLLCSLSNWESLFWLLLICIFILNRLLYISHPSIAVGISWPWAFWQCIDIFLPLAAYEVLSATRKTRVEERDFPFRSRSHCLSPFSEVCGIFSNRQFPSASEKRPRVTAITVAKWLCSL